MRFEIGSPFDVNFENVFSYLAEVESNWILFDDAVVSEVADDIVEFCCQK